MTADRPADPALGALSPLLESLLLASRLWAQGYELDDDKVDRIRHQAILLNHERYVETIPVYRNLAEDAGLREIDDVETIVNELLFTTELFKSYDETAMERQAYDEMTTWLASIFFRRPRLELEGVNGLATWRARLRQDGVFLGLSSATSGRPSFVPRDPLTLHALQENGRWYTRSTWRGTTDEGGYDCLVLGPRGTSLGIQSAGTGLARAATRSHYLFDVEIGPDSVVGAEAKAAHGASKFAGVLRPDGTNREAAYASAFQFLREAVRAGRPVLVFGAPAMLNDAALRAMDDGTPIRLGDAGLVVSGGGWKAAPAVSRTTLCERLGGAFGVGPDQFVDTYSTAEINCYLTSCRLGRYHVPPVIEAVVLDDLLRRCPGDDVQGLLAFLDPFAISYPGFVITGDVARLVYDGCGCGLAGWSIAGEIHRDAAAPAKGCAGALRSVLA